MMWWLQALIAMAQLGREVFKYLGTKEESKKTRAEKVIQMKAAVKKARLEGDTSEMENAFTALGFTHKLPSDSQSVPPESRR